MPRRSRIHLDGVPLHNTTYRRTGTLWDSRYKASLIQAETYLLTCMRYIELNPLRAALVDDPAHYRWTSYRGNARGRDDPLLTPHPPYLGLGATDTARRVIRRYRGKASWGCDRETCEPGPSTLYALPFTRPFTRLYPRSISSELDIEDWRAVS